MDRALDDALTPCVIQKKHLILNLSKTNSCARHKTGIIIMKKNLILLGMLSLFFSFSALAQDIIVTKEGKEIQAKVLEITETEIKYLDFENQDGPTYTLNKANVVLIRYQNGKNEVFSDDSKPKNGTYKPNTSTYVTDGMRYRDYKKLYDRHKYIRQFGDPYNPTLSGVASWLVPGLGQGLCDEWGRGLAVFGGYIVGVIGWGVTVISYSAPYYYYNYNTMNKSAPGVLIASALLIAYDIWNIVDAVHVAKIKNMYYQDIRGQQTSFNMSLTPCFTYLNTPEANAPVWGLSLNIGF